MLSSWRQTFQQQRPGSQGRRALSCQTILADQNKIILQREAFNLTRDQVEEAQAQGKPLTQTQIQEAYETNIQNVYDRQREQLSEQGAFPRTANMSQVVTSELNEISKNIQQGKTGIEISGSLIWRRSVATTPPAAKASVLCLT